MNVCYFDGRVCSGDDKNDKKKLVLRVRQNRTTGKDFYCCNFRFAVKARYSDEVNYINCRIFDEKAERFVDNVKVGMKLILEDCELKVEKYESEKYGSIENHIYIVNRWSFVESKAVNDKHRNKQDNENDDYVEEEVVTKKEKKVNSEEKKSTTVKSVSLSVTGKEKKDKNIRKNNDEWLGFDKYEIKYYLENPDMTPQKLKKLEGKYLASEEKKKLMLEKRKKIHAIMAKREGFTQANDEDVPFVKEG